MRPRAERAPRERRGFERHQAERTQPPGRGQTSIDDHDHRRRVPVDRPVWGNPTRGEGVRRLAPDALRRGSAATGIGTPCFSPCDRAGPKNPATFSAPRRTAGPPVQGAPRPDDATTTRSANTHAHGHAGPGTASGRHPDLGRPCGPPHDHGRDHGERVDGFRSRTGRNMRHPDSPCDREAVRRTRSATSGAGSRTRAERTQPPGRGANRLDDTTTPPRPGGPSGLGQSHPRRRESAPRADSLRRGSAATGIDSRCFSPDDQIGPRTPPL